MSNTNVPFAKESVTYTKQWLTDCQKQIVPYTKKNIIKILIETDTVVCSTCSKRASYIYKKDSSCLCWFHAFEINQKDLENIT